MITSYCDSNYTINTNDGEVLLEFYRADNTMRESRVYYKPGKAECRYRQWCIDREELRMIGYEVFESNYVAKQAARIWVEEGRMIGRESKQRIMEQAI